MMRAANIPYYLIYLRAATIPVIAGLAILRPPAAAIWTLVLAYIALASDVFDGIIARRLNVSTRRLRVMDTAVDLVFYLTVLSSIALLFPEVFRRYLSFFVVILSLEGLTYLLSMVKFRGVHSPHAIISKFWAISIFVEISILFISGDIGGHFAVVLSYGVVAHVDRLLITVFLREWAHDVPSCYHAYLLRRGKPIRRFGLFNG